MWTCTLLLSIFFTSHRYSEKFHMMQRLPLELAWLIYEHLEEFDLAQTPYSEFTEEPSDRLVYGSASTQKHRWRNNNWLKLRDTSRADILSARLVSSVFYDASHKTFAKLLADRTFRLTNVGFQDLILISRKRELLQHVRTLALGCAAFRRNMGINDSGFVWPCTFLSGLKMQDRSRLAAAYMQCRDWQHDNMEAHTKTLASILRALPNLDSIRIATVDPVFHLGGWLKPGDEDLLSRDHFFFQNRSSEALIQHYAPNSHPRMYTNESSVIRDCIIEAFKLSQLTLRDFRADPKPPVLDIVQASFITPALNTLRVVLAEDDLARLDLAHWSDLFSKATGLQDLSLGIDSARGSRANLNSTRPGLMCKDLILIAEQLFRALEVHSRLRRIELSGGWIFSEAALVDFVDTHVDALRCLILDEPMLFGSWDAALKSIARVTYGKAAFLKVSLPLQWPSLDLIPSGVDWEASLGFSHPFIWVTDP